MSKLTPKQQRFVDEYLIDLNATQAAIRAGYSNKTAEWIGPQLLKKTHVTERIEKCMKEREKRTHISQDRVLNELARIGFSDIRKAVKWTKSTVMLIASEAIDDDTAAAISEVSEGKEGLKLKLHDKKGALVDIGRHLGMFKDKAVLELTGKINTHATVELSDSAKRALDELASSAAASCDASSMPD